MEVAMHATLRPRAIQCVIATAIAAFTAMPCAADSFFFSTGNVTNLMASASRPDTGGVFEIESADDFLLVSPTLLTSGSFTGLIVPTGAAPPTIGQIVIEIYRVFPADSDVNRTSGPPT